jgi:large subunit ribosomal protein L4
MAPATKRGGGKPSAASRGAAAKGAQPKAPVLGKQAKADLPGAAFGEEFHESLVHETARADLAARRRGTASSLGRGEVAMTTAKAWRQKGTGRARAGALSVPHRRGGGVAFGPKPRDFAVKVNRKARRRALRSALSVHASRGSVAVLDASSFDEPATGRAAQSLEKWGAKPPTLVVLDPGEIGALKSFRNLPEVTVMAVGAVGVADIVGNASLVISRSALDVLADRASDPTRGNESAVRAESDSSEESEQAEVSDEKDSED